MEPLLRILGVLGLTFVMQGCGVYMAFTQPPEVNVHKFEHEGISRDLVVEELGAPRSSTRDANGTRTEIYEFYEGSHKGWKIGRGLFHLGADIVSLGLWEIVATPSEYLIRGDKIMAQARFDSNDLLTEFKVLKKPEPPKKDNGSEDFDSI